MRTVKRPEPHRLRNDAPTDRADEEIRPEPIVRTRPAGMRWHPDEPCCIPAPSEAPPDSVFSLHLYSGRNLQLADRCAIDSYNISAESASDKPAAERWACMSGPAGREHAALRPGAAAGCPALRSRSFKRRNSLKKVATVSATLFFRAAACGGRKRRSEAAGLRRPQAAARGLRRSPIHSAEAGSCKGRSPQPVPGRPHPPPAPPAAPAAPAAPPAARSTKKSPQNKNALREFVSGNYQPIAATPNVRLYQSKQSSSRQK